MPRAASRNHLSGFTACQDRTLKAPIRVVLDRRLAREPKPAKNTPSQRVREDGFQAKPRQIHEDESQIRALRVLSWHAVKPLRWFRLFA